MSNPRAVSEQNTKRTKKDILALEIELVDAEKTLELALLRVKTLTSALEEKRASIAPIRLASFDILSLVFEWCSIADWTSPLRIGGVCRSWRSIILNTPHAWKFIDMVDSDGDLCDIYFNRSKPCGLHVAAHELVDSPFADRVQCMTITTTINHVKIPVFPQLVRLCYTDSLNVLADLIILSISHFPLLRHLEIQCWMEATDDLYEFPPLETLIISVQRHTDGLPEIMEACRSSLVALTMSVYDWHHLDLIHIDLPNLLYLEISNQVHLQSKVSLDLTTPILKTYIEETVMHEHAFVQCQIPESTTHMRLDRFSLTSGLTQPRVLQLDMDRAQLLKFCDDIGVDAHRYSSLETIEFLRPRGQGAHLETMGVALNTTDWSGFTHLKHPPRLVDVWSAKLPGENGHLCGNNTPCAEWAGL